MVLICNLVQEFNGLVSTKGQRKLALLLCQNLALKTGFFSSISSIHFSSASDRFDQQKTDFRLEENLKIFFEAANGFEF